MHHSQWDRHEATLALNALVAADKLIRRHGWVQGHLHCDGRGYCLTGAVAAVTQDEGARDAALWFLRRACRSPLVVAWNDVAGRTKQEVSAVLAKAIKTARRATTP